MRVNEKKIGFLLVLAALIWIGFNTSQKLQPSSTQAIEPNRASVQQETLPRVSCQVLTVYDGDTLGCDINHNGTIERPEEEIRLLGIDSPEMHYSKKNKTHDSEHPTDEPFAKEASQWLEQRVKRRVVYLEFDARKIDKYGRTLAFVYPSASSHESFNAGQLKAGNAKLLFIGKNRLNEAAFQHLEDQARQQQRGLWGLN